MLEELGKDLWNVALAGIGAVTIAGEKAYEFGKVCIAKGSESLEKGKAVSEEWMRKGEQVAQEHRERCRQEALSRLTAEEREALRAKLDELDAEEARRAAEEKAAQEAEKVIDFESKDDLSKE